MEALTYSLIMPIYKNEAFVSELLEAAKFFDRTLDRPFEVVFVIDGSPDESHAKIKEAFLGSGLNYTIINHSRNFGALPAIRTGLTKSRGRYHAVMAADMQEPVQLIVDFFRILSANEADIVFGTRESRMDPWLKTLNAKVFWRLYRRFVNPDIPSSGVDVFGCTSEVKDKILNLNESNTSLIALLFWIGYRRKFVSYSRSSRREGKTGWTFRKNIKYLGDSVFGFTDLPIKILFLVGFVGLAVSLTVGGLALIGKLTGLITVPGYTTNIVAIGLFWATNMFSLGIIGAYVWRTYENTKSRPESLSFDKTIIGTKRSGVDKVNLKLSADLRGKLTFAELNQDLPFKVERYFLIYDVPAGQSRGSHAHRECSQFLTCVNGQVSVTVENSAGSKKYRLSQASEALFLPPLSWCVLEEFSSDASVLVLASHTYDKADYIHSYPEFKDLLLKSAAETHSNV